eukprot:TRINITY_DN1520_c0_g2_i3.p1 TRINITY_DN1520_c0_g2~~TRINITY_DN1520_c0_g2_i3.p1  ORF type:complete len:178 (+),score=5.29 TRINITY_DN1520_c0_g2_i3:779-1312(+)
MKSDRAFCSLGPWSLVLGPWSLVQVSQHCCRTCVKKFSCIIQKKKNFFFNYNVVADGNLLSDFYIKEQVFCIGTRRQYNINSMAKRQEGNWKKKGYNHRMRIWKADDHWYCNVDGNDKACTREGDNVLIVNNTKWGNIRFEFLSNGDICEVKSPSCEYWTKYCMYSLDAMFLLLLLL